MSKDLIILHGEIQTPPMSTEARREIGLHLRDLQEGKNLSLPHSRPMPTIGPGCHELRVPDADRNWRVMYQVTSDEIVIADVIDKDTEKTPKGVMDTCKARFMAYKIQKLAAAKTEQAKRKK